MVLLGWAYICASISSIVGLDTLALKGGMIEVKAIVNDCYGQVLGIHPS